MNILFKTLIPLVQIPTETIQLIMSEATDLQKIFSMLFSFSFLIVGLVLILLLKTNLRVFQGIYILLGAGLAVSMYLFFDPLLDGFSASGLFWLTVSGLAAGEIVMLLLLGFLGNRYSAKNYAALMFTIGLFPWYLKSVGFIYLVLMVIVTYSYSTFKLKSAFKAVGKEQEILSVAIPKLNENEKKIFKKKGAVIFAKPFLVTTLCFMVLLVII